MNRKKSKTTLVIKSFNNEEKSSKNEQMCQKKSTSITGTKGSILNIIALPSKEEMLQSTFRLSSSAGDDDHYFSLFPFRELSCPIHAYLVPSQAVASPAFLQQSTGQTKASAPLPTASSQNSLGMVTLNQIKGETKTIQNTPDKPILPFFTVLFFCQGRCSVQLKAQLCKELCPDSQTQEGRAGTGGASVAPEAESCLRPQ